MLNPLRLACQLALTTARFTVSFFSLSLSLSSSLSLSVYPSVRHPVSQRTAAAKSGCITKDINSGYWVLCATKKSAYKAGRKINASLLDCATVEDADPVETRAKSEPAKKLNYMQASGSSPSPAPSFSHCQSLCKSYTECFSVSVSAFVSFSATVPQVTAGAKLLWLRVRMLAQGGVAGADMIKQRHKNKYKSNNELPCKVKCTPPTPFLLQLLLFLLFCSFIKNFPSGNAI